MNPIAIFYHVRLNGSALNINQNRAVDIMCEQMDAIENSGLLDVAKEFHVASHGNEMDSFPARIVAGKKAIFNVNGDDDCNELVGELPTLGLLQDWIQCHPDWYVVYLHTKGVTKPDDTLRTCWRHCMMTCVVWRWEECVQALDNGCDMAGAHWLTQEKYPWKAGFKTPIWGGNFWWAKASYLLELPPCPRKPCVMPKLDIGINVFHNLAVNGMIAENWVGFSKRKIHVLDFAPHWPSIADCSKNQFSL